MEVCKKKENSRIFAMYFQFKNKKIRGYRSTFAITLNPLLSSKKGRLKMLKGIMFGAEKLWEQKTVLVLKGIQGEKCIDTITQLAKDYYYYWLHNAKNIYLYS